MPHPPPRAPGATPARPHPPKACNATATAEWAARTGFSEPLYQAALYPIQYGPSDTYWALMQNDTGARVPALGAPAALQGWEAALCGRQPSNSA